jgi:putative heme-binding domain-containing protein
MISIRWGIAALACGAAGCLLLGQAPAGDAARGKAIYLGKGNCQSCHRVNGEGSRLGPDLSDIGVPRGGRGGAGTAKQATPTPAPALDLTALQTSILDPDAEVANSNRLVRVVMKDGTSMTGRLLNHDNFTVQMIDPQGKLRSFQKADLRESTVLVKGLMPSYKGKLSEQEVADLVAYLSTLKAGL